ncbi:MAG: helix-turn-helix transcriptional regulator [Gallionella sp.]
MWKKKLKKLLANMTQTELADLLGLKQPYISQLLNGQVREPSYTIGQKIDARIALLDKKK